MAKKDKLLKALILTLFIGFAILEIYIVLHYINGLHFDTNIYPFVTISFLTEIFTYEGNLVKASLSL